jgi:hypothetical protein
LRYVAVLLDLRARIDIPCVIDDYNHWMSGCDKAYHQMISYYRPRLRCRRTWLPMFLHCLDVARVNSYIVALRKKTIKTQKDFVISWIKALNHRAAFDEQQNTRRAVAAFISPNGKGGSKRSRISNKNPQLPSYRFEGIKDEHIPTISTDQNGCTSCRFEYAKAKLEGTTPLPKVSKPSRKCLRCGDHLCMIHFGPFYGQN